MAKKQKIKVGDKVLITEAAGDSNNFARVGDVLTVIKTNKEDKALLKMVFYTELGPKNSIAFLERYALRTDGKPDPMDAKAAWIKVDRDLDADEFPWKVGDKIHPENKGYYSEFSNKKAVITYVGRASVMYEDPEGDTGGREFRKIKPRGKRMKALYAAWEARKQARQEDTQEHDLQKHRVVQEGELFEVLDGSSWVKAGAIVKASETDRFPYVDVLTGKQAGTREPVDSKHLKPLEYKVGDWVKVIKKDSQFKVGAKHKIVGLCQGGRLLSLEKGNHRFLMAKSKVEPCEAPTPEEIQAEERKAKWEGVEWAAKEIVAFDSGFRDLIRPVKYIREKWGEGQLDIGFNPYEPVKLEDLTHEELVELARDSKHLWIHKAKRDD